MNFLHLVRFAFCLSVIVVFTSLTGTTIATVQQKETRTVVDYFLALPDRYAGETTREERKRLVSEDFGRVMVKDLKNGYLTISGDGGSPGFIVAIFKKPDGKYLVGINPYFEMGEDFYLLSYENGKWINLTRMIIPEYNSKLHYDLPQYGTTIKVQNQSGKNLYELAWKEGQFVKK